MNKQNYIYFLTLGFFLFLCVIVFAANTGKSSLFFNVIGKIPSGDKLAHFMLAAIFTMLINASLKHRFIQLFHIPVLLGSLIAFFIVSAEECTQLWIPSRNFELADLISDYGGIIAVSYFIFQKNKPKHTKK